MKVKMVCSVFEKIYHHKNLLKLESVIQQKSV